jgi:hypothetical protein
MQELHAHSYYTACKSIGVHVRDPARETPLDYQVPANLTWHLKKDLNELSLAKRKIGCKVNAASRDVHGFHLSRGQRRCHYRLQLQWNVHSEPANGSTLEYRHAYVPFRPVRGKSE